MNQQKKTTTLSNKSNKRARGKLDDLITRLNPDTIQSLIAVLKEHSVVEIIDSLNEALKNPVAAAKKRPNVGDSSVIRSKLISMNLNLNKISSRLTGMERQLNRSAVDEKPIILNGGQAVSKSIFEAVSKHIQTMQPRFNLDAVIPRGTRLMLVVFRGDRHDSSKLFLCPTQKKLEDLFKHFQIRDEVTPEMIHVITAVPCEPVDWICFIDLPGEIIMLDNFSVLSSNASLVEAQIQHPCVLSPNQQSATIQKQQTKVPQPVASTTCASLGNSTAPVVKSPPTELQPPLTMKMVKVHFQIIHENGTQKNLTILRSVLSTLNIRGFLKNYIPFLKEMPFKCYKKPSGSHIDYLILVGSNTFIETKAEAEIVPLEEIHDIK